jgi:hypothetical protein
MHAPSLHTVPATVGLCCAFFVACGGGASPASEVSDAGASGREVDAGEIADTGVERACDLEKPFGPAVPVAGLATTEQREILAHFSNDELTAYFVRIDELDSGGYAGVVRVSTRASSSDPFSESQAMLPPAPEYMVVGSPAVTADGETFFYALTDDNTGLGRIWTASSRTCEP